MSQEYYQNHLNKQDQENRSYLTKGIKYKRPLALIEILNIQESLKIMRKKYKNFGWYERKEMEQNAKQLKERLKKQTTQYKIYCKKFLDEWGKQVVDRVF